MGTLNFAVTRYGKSGSQNAFSAQVKTSGAFTTSTSAANVEDASGDISLAAGDVLSVSASEDMRLRFGATAATSTTGHFVPANTLMQFEVDAETTGVVSAIDVA